jgi:hypothetical protein
MQRGPANRCDPAAAVRLRTATGLRDDIASHKHSERCRLHDGVADAARDIVREIVNVFRPVSPLAACPCRGTVKNLPQNAEIKRSFPVRIARPPASSPKPQFGRETGTTHSLEIALKARPLGTVPA